MIKNRYKSFSILIIEIAFSFFLWTLFNINDLKLNIEKDRGWPPCLIYRYELPSKFNVDLINKTNPNFFLPFDQNFQFIIEPKFSKMINQIPILTNNIENATFVYMNFFPGFMAKSGKKL